ncbi:MAG TPA: Fe-S cluster assembly ATPase SufC [Acidimicrobiia bacterium]
MSGLRIEGLTARVGGKEILRGIDLEVPFGECHALMGPNGSGKSTLCHVLTGKEGYEVGGSVRIDGVDLLEKEVDDRARLGLMQAFQYPVEIPGLTLRELLEEALEEATMETAEAELTVVAATLDMERFLDRSVNDDLSGGEKKRSELYQMQVLRPRVAVLDEIDSGLDIDAVRQVAEGVEDLRGPERALLLITHYNRIFRYLTPDRVHVIMGGVIIASGGPELADDLEAGGYRKLGERLGIPEPEAEPSRIPKASEQLTDTPFDL